MAADQSEADIASDGDSPEKVDPEFDSSENSPDESSEKNSEKIARIQSSLSNVDQLKYLCKSPAGLVNSNLRVEAWPRLILSDELETIYQQPTAEEIQSHKDHTQVYQDVSRSLKRFPPSIQHGEAHVTEKYMDHLMEIILQLLDTDDCLHYYQGFHDIVVTFLIVLGKEKTFFVMQQLVQTHLKKFMARTMDETNQLLYLIPAIVEKEDKKLFNFLMKAEVGVIFALPWVITWFSHTLDDLDLVLRLFDLFIVSDPLLPVFLSAAIVLHLSSAVQQCDCDMPSVHQFLSNHITAADGLPWEDLIADANSLFKQYSYESLRPRALHIKKLSTPEPRRRQVQRRQSNIAVIVHLLTMVKQQPSVLIAISVPFIAYLLYKYRTLSF